MGSMKVHHLARGFISSSWDQEHQQQPSLSRTCSKPLRPLAPKLAATSTTPSPPRHNHSTFDLKTFIRPGPRKHLDHKQDISQVEITHPGGTRWNPTQEQIGILEMLYREGMRTPNAQHIEQITAQLSRYGKIEGKNVFYWFQNHKARERQKQKRNASLSLSHSPPPTPTPITTAISLNNITRGEVLEREEEISPYKRKCKSWAFECLELEENKSRSRDEELEERTLELFPLHPEGR